MVESILDPGNPEHARVPRWSWWPRPSSARGSARIWPRPIVAWSRSSPRYSVTSIPATAPVREGPLTPGSHRRLPALSSRWRWRPVGVPFRAFGRLLKNIFAALYALAPVRPRRPESGELAPFVPDESTLMSGTARPSMSLFGFSRTDRTTDRTSKPAAGHDSPTSILCLQCPPRVSLIRMFQVVALRLAAWQRLSASWKTARRCVQCFASWA